MNEKKLCYILICLLAVFCFAALMFSSAAFIATEASYSAVTTAAPKLVIDPGHGGEDGGAVNDDGVTEKDINLTIAKDADALARFFGFQTIMTRTDDFSLSGGEATIRQRKVSDMKKRLEMYNSDESNVVISIHQNKFSQAKYYGTQLFYSENNEKSKYLADNIRLAVKGMLQPENEREIKGAGNDIYLLKNSTQPAVIVECGFISNKEECAKLLDRTYQKQMSLAIICGLLSYCNTVN